MVLAEFIGAATLTAAVLLLAWLGQRLRGRRLPRATWPALVGASLIGYGIYSEYSWATRVRAELPESVRVVRAVESRSMLAPWSLLVPRVDRLAVVDTDATRRHPALPDHLLVEIVLLRRLHPTLVVRELLDCGGRRRAALDAEEAFGSDGLPREPRWRAVEEGDPMLDALCPGT